MEKERYVYLVETNQLYDNEKDDLYAWNINNNKIIKLLNQQDARIKELENGLLVANDCADRYWKQLDILEQENSKLQQENQQLKEQIEKIAKDYASKIAFYTGTENQKAIEVLEKVKGFIFKTAYNSDEITFANWVCENCINNQIKELREE